jgi:hypothetical protein
VHLHRVRTKEFCAGGTKPPEIIAPCVHSFCLSRGKRVRWRGVSKDGSERKQRSFETPRRGAALRMRCGARRCAASCAGLTRASITVRMSLFEADGLPGRPRSRRGQAPGNDGWEAAMSHAPDAACRAALAAWCAAEPGPYEARWLRRSRLCGAPSPDDASHRRGDAAPRPGHRRKRGEDEVALVLNDALADDGADNKSSGGERHDAGFA